MSSVSSLSKKIAGFGIVGVLATGLDFLLLFVLTEFAGLDYLASATISYLVSLVFNYLASMKYVFRRKDELSRTAEFALFCLLSFIGLLLNDLIMFLGTTVAGINYLITKVGATGLVMAWNFASRKHFLDADA